MRKNYPQIPRRNHRKLKWAPLVFIRREPSLYLEFNSKATEDVARYTTINLQDDHKYGVQLSFDLARMEIQIKFLGYEVPKDNKNPFLANMSVMSDQRDQFKLSCAAFLRVPQIKAMVKYLALCESDFGVVKINGGVKISLNPIDQVPMSLRLGRPVTSLADLEPEDQSELIEALKG